jgi:hypothetical protein
VLEQGVRRPWAPDPERRNRGSRARITLRKSGGDGRRRSLLPPTPCSQPATSRRRRGRGPSPSPSPTRLVEEMPCRSAGSRRHHTTCEERPAVAIPATRGLAGSVLRRRRSRRGAGSEGGAAEARLSTRAVNMFSKYIIIEKSSQTHTHPFGLLVKKRASSLH